MSAPAVPYFYGWETVDDFSLVYLVSVCVLTLWMVVNLARYIGSGIILIVLIMGIGAPFIYNMSDTAVVSGGYVAGITLLIIWLLVAVYFESGEIKASSTKPKRRRLSSMSAHSDDESASVHSDDNQRRYILTTNQWIWIWTCSGMFRKYTGNRTQDI